MFLIVGETKWEEEQEQEIRERDGKLALFCIAKFVLGEFFGLETLNSVILEKSIGFFFLLSVKTTNVEKLFR